MTSKDETSAIMLFTNPDLWFNYKIIIIIIPMWINDLTSRGERERERKRERERERKRENSIHTNNNIYVILLVWIALPLSFSLSLSLSLPPLLSFSLQC